MPQVDLETLVSVCGGGAAVSDRKIACETLADGDQPPEKPNRPELSPDFPPESFWLSKDSEFDWFDRNAIFERKESTKGNSNSTSSNLNSNSNFYSNSNSNSSSQRFSKNLKSKASIIGLPKTQKTNYIDPNRRNCKPVNIRMFPKRSNSVGKSIIPMIEPSSPKVSCMGRVRSKRGRRRPSEPTKVKTKSKPSEPTKVKTKSKPSEPTKVKTKSSKRAEKTRTAAVHRRSGFLGGFMSIFRSDRRKKPAVERDEGEQLAESPPRNSVTMKLRQIPISFEPVAEPPGLGGMMRFSSGRKSESWSADDLEVGMAISEIQNRPIEITV